MKVTKRMKIFILLLCAMLVFEGGIVKVSALNTEEKSPPIIVIPGILGSSLYNSPNYFNGMTQVWSPISINYFTTGNQLKMDKQLFVKPPENQNDKKVKKEYGPIDIYQTLMKRLCKEFPYREIYFFSYDFRQDNAKTAGLLHDFIEQKGFDSIDIIAHSMGGLVASSYVAQFENNRSEKKINKVISLGTAYEGAAQLSSAIVSKDIADNKAPGSGPLTFMGIVDLFFWFGGFQREVKAQMPALAQTAPTKAHLENGDPFYQKTGTERYGFLNLQSRPVYSEIDYAQYKNISTVMFGDNYEKAENFYESIKEDGVNVLMNLDNSYFAIGVGQFTISALKFNDQMTLNKLEVDEYIYEQQGDGMATYLSASMANQLETLPNADQRFKKFEANHLALAGFDILNDFTGDEKAVDWVIEILKTGTSSVESDTAESEDYLVLKVSGDANIQIENEGEVLSTTAKNFSDTATFGRIDYIEDTNEIVICMKDKGDYDINVFCAKEEVVDLSISHFDAQGDLLAVEEYDKIKVQDNEIVVPDQNSDFEHDIKFQTADKIN